MRLRSSQPLAGAWQAGVPICAAFAEHGIVADGLLRHLHPSLIDRCDDFAQSYFRYQTPLALHHPLYRLALRMINKWRHACLLMRSIYRKKNDVEC